MLDSGEAPIVRSQAGCIITNLISKNNFSNSAINSKETRVSGLLAIIALFDHMNFFSHVDSMLNNYTSDIISKQPVTMNIMVNYVDVALFHGWGM